MTGGEQETFADQETSYLSGVSVSRLSAVAPLISDDMFLVSEPCLDVRRPVNWYSKSVQFMQLSAKVMADISAGWRFGSMAWESSGDYARWDHTHGCYNRVAGMSCYYEDDSSAVDIGTITVDSVTHHLRVPAPVIGRVDAPCVGQLRFSAAPGVPVTDWTDKAFDGWVYPDGKAYPLSAFDIDGEFASYGDVFYVPVLSDFIRINSRPYDQVYAGSDYQDFMPQHRHFVDLTLSGSASGKFKYRASDAGAGHGSHGASKQNRLNAYAVGMNYSGMKISDTGYMAYCEDSGDESYPSWTDVRTMIYIGLPKFRKSGT